MRKPLDFISMAFCQSQLSVIIDQGLFLLKAKLNYNFCDDLHGVDKDGHSAGAVADEQLTCATAAPPKTK